MSAFYAHLMAFATEDWPLLSFGDTVINPGGLMGMTRLPYLLFGLMSLNVEVEIEN